MYVYKAQGVCARAIAVELEGDIVKEVAFQGGCDGNGKAVARLVKGLTVDECIDRLRGNTCGWKDTSCADQLTYALEEARAASE